MCPLWWKNEQAQHPFAISHRDLASKVPPPSPVAGTPSLLIVPHAYTTRRGPGNSVGQGEGFVYRCVKILFLPFFGVGLREGKEGWWCFSECEGIYYLGLSLCSHPTLTFSPAGCCCTSGSVQCPRFPETLRCAAATHCSSVTPFTSLPSFSSLSSCTTKDNELHHVIRELQPSIDVTDREVKRDIMFFFIIILSLLQKRYLKKSAINFLCFNTGMIFSEFYEDYKVYQRSRPWEYSFLRLVWPPK